MEGNLYETALTGDTCRLRELLDEYGASILEHFVGDNVLRENALHVAARLGNLEFAKEIITVREELASQLNSHGQYPLHVTGHKDVARALLETNTDVCFVRDKHGRTPFHIAAIKGRLDVLQELIDAKKEAAWVLTDDGEPLLHLCVKNDQYEALAMLVNKIEEKGFYKLKDSNDNTILHLLVAQEWYRGTKKVLKKIKNESYVLDAVNEEKRTALDLARKIKGRIIRMKFKLALYGAGAKQKDNAGGGRRRWRRRPLKTIGDLGRDHREVLMVVAILIATVTFSAALNPPGGVWQEDGEHIGNAIINYCNQTSPKQLHYAGQAILSDKYPVVYVAFTVFNSVGFLASVILIMVLTNRPLFKRKLFILAMNIFKSIALLSLFFCFFLSVPTFSNEKFYSTPLFLLAVLVMVVMTVFVGFGFVISKFIVLIFRTFSWLLEKMDISHHMSVWFFSCWNQCGSTTRYESSAV